jgi:hypothetical protein
MAEVAIPRKLFAAIMQRIAALRSPPLANGRMNTSAIVWAGKTTRDLRPFDHAARVFGARRADAGFISGQTDGPAGREPRNLPEPSGGGWKGTVNGESRFKRRRAKPRTFSDRPGKGQSLVETLGHLGDSGFKVCNSRSGST